MIIVFGSNILDQFFELQNLDLFTNPHGEDALHLPTHTEAPGGKGANQAVAAAKAGGQVRFFGAVGDGGHGRALIQNFQNHGINTTGILLSQNHPTGVASILNMPGGKHKIVVSQGANADARASQIPDEILNDKALLLLQAELNSKENESLMKRAKSKGAKIVLNIAPANPVSAEALQCVDYLVVNEAEAEATAKNLGIVYKNAEQIASVFAQKFNLVAIVTLGDKGAVAVSPANVKEALFVPTLKIKAVDSVGAGDAFCGALAAAIDKNMSLADALKRASVAGALACTKIGAQSALPTGSEIDQHLQQFGAIVIKASDASGIAA